MGTININFLIRSEQTIIIEEKITKVNGEVAIKKY